MNLHKSRKVVVTTLIAAALAARFGARSVRSTAEPASNSGSAKVKSTLPSAKNPFSQNNTYGRMPGDPLNGVRDLSKIYKCIAVYRARHNGLFPPQISDLYADTVPNYKMYGYESLQDAQNELLNPDTRYADSPSFRKSPEIVFPYFVTDRRPNRESFTSSKLMHTRDAVAWTDIYQYQNRYLSDAGRTVINPIGYWIVLWDNGSIEKIPYDDIVYMAVKNGFYWTFPDQAGVPNDSATYAEYWTQVNKGQWPPLGKPTPADKDEPVPDNGGPESLVAFSRLLSFPSRYGIEREELWKNFDPAQSEFTLADVQAGAAKLKLPLELKVLSLDELQKLQAPAVFLTSDDKRVVVLSQLDDKQAIVIDRGLTRIVPRDLLALRYGGQALIAPGALAPQANAPQVLADDPVRLLWLTSPEQVVTQTVKITNRGGTPLTLQIERPIPGCEKAELSLDILAPGASATLSLSLRWRSVLKSPTQNVLVFVKTNAPERPRLPLGFKLLLPQPAAPATP